MSEELNTEVNEDEKKESKPVKIITDSDRDEVMRKEWKPHYEEQLQILKENVRKHCGEEGLTKEVIKKLKATAKLCAKNKAKMDKLQAKNNG